MRSLANVPIIRVLFTWKQQHFFSFFLLFILLYSYVSLFLFVLSRSLPYFLSFNSCFFLSLLTAIFLFFLFFTFTYLFLFSISSFLVSLFFFSSLQFISEATVFCPSLHFSPSEEVQPYKVGLGQKSQERWVLIFPSLLHSRFFPPLIKVLLEF